MSITRKIIRIVQYISLAIFIYLLLKLLLNSFKYIHLKTLLSSLTFFTGSFLFLMLTESKHQRRKNVLGIITAILLLVVIIIFNLILFEMIQPDNWQKALVIIFPVALLLAVHNQVDIHISRNRSTIILINNFLIIINLVLLYLFVFAVKLSLLVILITLCLNFFLSLYLVIKR